MIAMHMLCRRLRASLCVAVILSGSSGLAALTLEEGFLTPPNDAKPYVWYHMMNGNVTKEGITCDFESLAAAGIGGVEIFDVGCYIPAGPVAFNTPAWLDIMRHVQNEAKRVGLEVVIANCSGWSNLGGPWIAPADAMKVTTFTETAFRGPGRFSGILPRTAKDNGFYEDIAVLAYPTPKAGATLSDFDSKRGAARRIQRKMTLIERPLGEFDDSKFPKAAGIRRDTKEFGKEMVVAKDEIVDLTSRMDAEGRLEWDAPEGDWTILRIGFICKGKKNHPASKFGRGLEVDKLSASAVERHFNGYVGRLCDELGISSASDNSTGIGGVLVDSWEAGCQNWTQGFDVIFEKRLGYSIRPWLPVLAGRIVKSVKDSERFLEDFRRLIADLFSENYARRFAELCHQRGLKFHAEPYGDGNFDNLQYGGAADVPMAEFWSNAGLGAHGVAGIGNTRCAAHLAHVWGRRFAAAESFTENPPKSGRWLTTPFDIKSQCDKVYAAGINRIVYHRFVHQPWPGNRYLPGMTMGRWGMHFDRTQTWWPVVNEFTKYQSRCQWMLQEGTFVADILYWCGEDAPNDGRGSVTPPDGFDYDICATEVIESLKVKDGKIVAPGGVAYEMLVLPSCATMSGGMARRVGELAAAGARIVSPRRPTRSPGLTGDAAPSYGRTVAEAWSKRVMECSVAEALSRLDVQEDVVAGDAEVDWIHRRDSSADWYFVDMDNPQNVSFEVSFRQTGRVPEIWNAETGRITAPSAWREEDGRIFVTLDFPPSGSAFVVFRKDGAKTAHRDDCIAPQTCAGSVTPVTGPWCVTFPTGWYVGSDETKVVEWQSLKDWTTDADPDIKYFSGTATYRVSCPASSAPSSRVILDLGEVKNFAQVTVNGRTFPALWRPPYRVDITDAISGDRLDLEIKVTNLWPNRLVGDDILCAGDCEWDCHPRQGHDEYSLHEIPRWVKNGELSPTGRKTFTTWRHWTKHDALLPSGLLGSVRLVLQNEIKVKENK